MDKTELTGIVLKIVNKYSKKKLTVNDTDILLTLSPAKIRARDLAAVLIDVNDKLKVDLNSLVPRLEYASINGIVQALEDIS